jgi:hypothetical protein
LGLGFALQYTGPVPKVPPEATVPSVSCRDTSSSTSHPLGHSCGKELADATKMSASTTSTTASVTQKRGARSRVEDLEQVRAFRVGVDCDVCTDQKAFVPRNAPLTVMMVAVTPLVGVTRPLTDVLTVLLRICRPAWGVTTNATDRAGWCTWTSRNSAASPTAAATRRRRQVLRRRASSHMRQGAVQRELPGAPP